MKETLNMFLSVKPWFPRIKLDDVFYKFVSLFKQSLFNFHVETS